jgi:hypothetical protein
MITIERLKQVQVVYTHAHCPDGLASAMILKDAVRMLGTAPRIEFLAHGTEEHKRAGAGVDELHVLFCDIAPHADLMSMLLDAQASPDTVIVLDHHVGARAIVEAFGKNGVYADAEKEPGVSGAVLAFREVWAVVHEQYSKTQPVELSHHIFMHVQNFARDIGARDTWQTEHPRFVSGQHASKVLMSRSAASWLADGRLPYLLELEMAAGRALFEAHQNAVAEAVEQAVYYLVPNEVGAQRRLSGSVGTRTCLAVFQEQSSGFRLASDVAEHLRLRDEQCGTQPDWERVDAVAGFSYVVDKPGGDPRVLYSLRGSHGFDVCAFAKRMGGGGHKAASGFTATVEQVSASGGPYQFIRGALGLHLDASR